MCPVLNKVMTWLKLFYLWILRKKVKSNGTKGYKEGQDVKQCEVCCQPLIYYCTTCQKRLCEDCSLKHVLNEPEKLINILLGKNVMHIIAWYRNKNNMDHELPLCRSHTNTYCTWFCLDCNILFCKLCSHNIMFHRIVSINTFMDYNSELLKEEYKLLQKGILPDLKQFRQETKDRITELESLKRNAYNLYSENYAQLFINTCLRHKCALLEGLKLLDWKIAVASQLLRENRRHEKCPLYLQMLSKPLQLNVWERFGFDKLSVPGRYSTGTNGKLLIDYYLISGPKYQLIKPISPSIFFTEHGTYTTISSIIMLLSKYRIFTLAFLVLLFIGFSTVLCIYCFPVLQKLTNDLIFLANNPAHFIENAQNMVSVWMGIIVIVIALAGNRGRGPYFDF